MDTLKNIYKSLYLSDVKPGDEYDLGVHKASKKPAVKEWAPISSYPGAWQGDLLFLESYKNQNHGYKMILNLIEILTRRMIAIPLKKKSDAPAAILEFVDKEKPNLLETDAGGEFISKDLLKKLESKGVKTYNTTNKRHVGVVERANRTLRSLIERLITLTGDYNYVDHLPKIVEAYNAHVNRKIGAAPNEMREADQIDLMLEDNKKTLDVISKVDRKFKVGSKVRILNQKGLFEKGATPKLSLKVYTVTAY